MAPNDDNPEEQKRKKYLWFGYGSYSQFGEFGPTTTPGNIRADPSIFDQLFELFGVKEKPEKGSEEDKQ